MSKYTEQQKINITNFDKLKVKIKKFVMIGDNNDTDILGANIHGWDSIMVMTGPVH